MREDCDMTITEFLLARIDEDETVARAADGPDWSPGYERDGEPGKWRGIKAWLVCLRPDDPINSMAVGDVLLSGRQGATTHAVRFDPARALAECEAKRRIVEHHSRDADPEGDDMADTCAICSSSGPDAQGWPCDTLRYLAVVYADHPDYDPAWALS